MLIYDDIPSFSYKDQQNRHKLNPGYLAPAGIRNSVSTLQVNPSATQTILLFP